MPLFEYQGRNLDRKIVKGQLEAATPSAVANLLLQQRITPVSIELIEEKTSVWDSVKNRLFPGRIHLEDLIIFCRQMYTLTKAGVPIVRILSHLVETVHSRRFIIALRGIIDMISAGQTLTHALSKYPDIFSPVFVNTVHAGESSGRLEEIFMRLTDYLELELRTAKQIRTALRYPMLLVIAISTAFVVINFFVIPVFTKLYQQFSAELPLPTRILIATSTFLITHRTFLLILLGAVLLGTHLFLKTSGGRFLWDRLKLQMPVFGALINRIIMARFARTFAMIMRTGVPLAEGVSLVANAIGNTFIRARVLKMRESIERGETLTQTATASRLFTPLVLQMFSVGEESGTVDTLMEQVADFYEREIDYDLKRLGDLIEPILLLMMGVIVFILALGVFLPMWNMVKFIKMG